MDPFLSDGIYDLRMDMNGNPCFPQTHRRKNFGIKILTVITEAIEIIFKFKSAKRFSSSQSDGCSVAKSRQQNGGYFDNIGNRFIINSATFFQCPYEGEHRWLDKAGRPSQSHIRPWYEAGDPNRPIHFKTPYSVPPAAYNDYERL